MKREPVRTDAFDERLRDVFTLDAATPVLDEYLSSIQIDDENPGFLVNWEMDSLVVFVDAANAENAALAPMWLQTQPPSITVTTFTDDLMRELEQFAGGRCGRVLLAPNDFSQIANIAAILADFRTCGFMQAVAQAAFGSADRPIATTYSLTEPRAQRSVPNKLPPVRRNNQVLHRLFI